MTSETEHPQSVAEVTLSGFLLARLAEEEDGVAALREDGAWDVECHPVTMTFWLADVEAKRRIVADYLESVETYKYAIGGADSGLLSAIEHLASVYADHPDYREEWRA